MIAVTTAGMVEEEALGWVMDALREGFGMEVGRIAPFPEPFWAWDERRRQHSSTLLLHDAVRRLPENAVKLLVLTDADLFIPMLSFVYGQAQLDGRVAILSLARLRQEFYGLPPDAPLLRRRVRKETLHETGHTFGLTHCDDPSCAMAISTNVDLLDAKRDEFCSSCAILLGDVLHAGSGAR